MPLTKNELLKAKRTLLEKGVKEYFIDILIEYLNELSKSVKIEGILIYGSVARGNAIPGKSDVDIIIISEDFKRRDNIFKLKRELRGKLPTGVDAMWMSKKDFEGALVGLSGAILDALYEGIILYDEDGFLTRMKKRLFKAIERGEIERYRNYWRFPKVKLGKKTKIRI